MGKRTATTVFLLGFLCGMSTVSADSAVRTRSTEKAEQAEFQVRIARRVPTRDPGCQRIVLEVISSASRQRTEITIDAPFRAASGPLELLVWGDKVLLLGADANGKKIVQRGLRAPHTEEEEIRCLSFAISPRRDRVAFVNWQLRFVPQTHSTVLSVLSLKGKRITDDVVFPETNARSRTRMVHEVGESLRRSLVSPILWSDDERRLVFFERRGGRNSLVQVRLDTPFPAIYGRQLDVDDLASDPEEDPDRGFGVESLSWKGPGKIRAKLVEQSYWKQRVITLPLPDSRNRQPR